LSDDSVEAAITLARQGLKGKSLEKALDAAGPTVRALFRAVRLTRARVFGSGASYRSLRSKALGLHCAVAEWTMMININPSELHCRLVFHLHGRPYNVVDGRPSDDRPDLYQRWLIVATDPVAVAVFANLFVRAFCQVFMNWDFDAGRQTSPSCLFGAVLALLLKPESSGRGGEHCHGEVAQPANAAMEVQRRLADDAQRATLMAFWDSLVSVTPTLCRPMCSVRPFCGAGDSCAAVWRRRHGH